MATDTSQQRSAAPVRGLSHAAPLTGLRAVAIVLVVLFVALRGAGLGRGGWVGLDVFFVLSGFLITTTLLDEVEQTGSFSLGAFYLRRVLRLWPAYLVFLAGMAGYARLAHRAEFGSWAHQLLVALTFRSNLYSVDHPAHTGLGQLWTLSTEAQFYLLWPLVLLACLRLKSRRAMLLVTGLGALASLVDSAVLTGRHASYQRLFFAPDTNAAALLIGCALGIAFTAGYLDRLAPTRFARLFPVAFLAVLALWTLTVSDHDVWQFAGAVQVLCLATGIAIVCLVLAPQTWLGRLLAMPIAVWLGALSYSLYLWSVVALNAGPKAGHGLEDHVVHYGVQLLLLVELPVVSYYLIERHGPPLWSRLRARGRAAPATDEPTPIESTGLFDELVDMDGAASHGAQPQETYS
ncbi:acyltransferase [Jatrophihabitans sp.]|uniref:acyltransferase family protein n=1 Tax=Jatrophihabitans sp. TaxID=1932789 RepID=UPI0030C6FD8D|nr:acyltransferase 3 [Jatrophihabitans sp.]